MSTALYTTTDQMGREVLLPRSPRRIVSLVPSQTELLFDLGLDDEVVGITKFCVHPEHQYRRKPRIGGTKSIKLDRVRALTPDLIIGNKEENTKEQIETLAREFPVWLSDITTLEDARTMIEQVGTIINKLAEARRLSEQIGRCFAQLKIAGGPLRVAYLIWHRPFMVAAADTFIDHLLKRAGFLNVFGDLQRYPEVTLEAMRDRQPDVLLLSSEPFPFKEKHFATFRKVMPSKPIRIVDGEMFSWYGSRLLLAADYFAKIQHELLQVLHPKA